MCAVLVILPWSCTAGSSRVVHCRPCTRVHCLHDCLVLVPPVSRPAVPSIDARPLPPSHAFAFFAARARYPASRHITRCTVTCLTSMVCRSATRLLIGSHVGSSCARSLDAQARFDAQEVIGQEACHTTNNGDGNGQESCISIYLCAPRSRALRILAL